MPWRPPLAFSRRISLWGDEILFDYRIENLSADQLPFLWAWHSLFSWQEGDRIHFSDEMTNCLSPEGVVLPWPETLPGCDLSTASFKEGVTPAAKVFTAPLAAGKALIRAKDGTSISLTWPATGFPHAGIWITRGFWKGLHHWAIEPTNAPVDRLSDITDHSRRTMLEPREIRNWHLVVKLGRAEA